MVRFVVVFLAVLVIVAAAGAVAAVWNDQQVQACHAAADDPAEAMGCGNWFTAAVTFGSIVGIVVFVGGTALSAYRSRR